MRILQSKILIYVFTGILLFSCEILDQEKKIKIDANPFAPGVVRIHVAVLEGEDILSQKVYEKEDANPDGSVEIYTTPGSGRVIVVIAEDDQGFASHFSSKTVEVDSDGEAVEKLVMKRVGDIWNDISFLRDEYVVTWPSAEIINSAYYLFDTNAFDVIYSGESNSVVLNSGSGYTCSFQVAFYPSNFKTDSISINIGGLP